MRFALSYPIVSLEPPPVLLASAAIAEITSAAEAAGFGAVSFTEHPAPPATWRDDHGHDAVDPFVGLAVAAASSATIRLLTYATVVPYRNPFVLAKAAATLDQVSGGRLVLGVGTGYLRGEFAAVGVDFDERNALFDEAIGVLRRAWSGEPVTVRGRHFDAHEIVCRPVPVQPQPPIWIGGNSARTRQRVAEWADGWLPIPTRGAQVTRRSTAALATHERLAEMIDEIRRQRVQAGRRGGFDVMYTVEQADPWAESDAYLAQVRELEQAGVTWVNVVIGGTRVDAIVDGIVRFGAQIIDLDTGSRPLTGSSPSGRAGS
jgi:probable F420-dependent oxidoreductase